MGTVNVVQVQAGDQHGLALTNGSKLYAWGNNEFGQCGLGPKASKVVSTPQVLLTNITMLQKLSKCEVKAQTEEFICHSILHEVNFGKI